MLISPGLEAEARTKWVQVSANPSQGKSMYVANVRPVQGELHDRMFETLYTNSSSSSVNDEYLDCLTGESWIWVSQTEEWSYIGYYQPGSFGEGIYKYVCPGY